MILSNIKQFFNKKPIYYIVFFLVLFLFQYDSTFAADNELIKKIETFSSWLLQWVGVLLGLATYLATMFLSPEWINGSIFGLDKYFKDVWILVSNVVYFVFAFVLIWIAFMNIIWKSDDQYQLKQALPKFIIWVIMVPFSWFLVQFILSISAILTVASLSLPFDTFPKHEAAFDDINVPIACTLDLKSIWTDATTATSTDWYIYCEEWNTISVTELIWSDHGAVDSIFWIISIYTYWILSFDAIDDLDKSVASADTTKNVSKTLWDVIVKILFDVLFVLIYAILMITLWLVLMIRGIYIWIYTMMSPVFWLMYFFDKKDWGWDWFFSKFNIKELIALAMVPVYTMLALSFWLLFIYVTWEWMANNPSTEESSVKIWDKWFEIWKFTLNIEWTVWSKIDSAGSFFWQLWAWGLWVVGTLILKIFGIVVLWWTVMAAMRTSEITKTITQPLHDFGTKVWWIVAASPGNLPIFGGQSMKSMWTVAWKYQSHIDSKQVDKAWTFVGKHMKFMDTESVSKTAYMDKAIWRLNNEPNMWAPKYVEELRWILKEMKTPESIIGNKQAQEALTVLAKQSWVSESERKDFKFDTVDKIARVISIIDAKLDDKWASLIWSHNDSSFNGKELSNFMNGLLDWTNWNTNSSNSSWLNVEAGRTPDTIDITVDWANLFTWKQNTAWYTESFTPAWYAELAKYIVQNNFNEEKFTKNIVDKLNIDHNEVDNIKKEISAYIKKDWDEFTLHWVWWQSDSNLDDYFTKNKPE